VHLLALGHAIVGDALYATRRIQAMSSRLLLHAGTLELSHPATAQTMRFVSTASF
jgi:tRNA pseudouridine32 synthase/23S rRNA pseudouridine746 synthase